MDIILGIDVGGSTHQGGGAGRSWQSLSMLRVRAEDQVTSLFGALGNYLSSNHLTLEDVRRVVLTGVGASYVDGNIYGLPTYRVDEFSASGAGASRFPARSAPWCLPWVPAQHFYWLKKKGRVQHLCGSGIGGGTLGGYATSWLVWERFGQIKNWPLGEI